MTVRLLHLPGVPDTAASGPGHPSDWRRIEPREDHSQGRLRVYVHLVVLTVTGCPAVTDGLDGDLARLQQWPRREDGPVRVRAAGCGAQPVRRVARGPCLGGRRRGYRTKASGRRWCGGFPAGASRPLSAVCASSPAVPRARSRAARRAARSARP